MKTIIEFTWNNNYKFIIIHIVFLVIRNLYSFTSKLNTKRNKNTIIMFELITECSLIFSFIPFLIEKYRKKNSKKIYKINFKNKLKEIKYKNNIIKILILIIISSIIKFNYTIITFEVFIEYFYEINKNSYYYSNSIMMLSIISFIFIRIKILKNNFYLHHLISMLLIIITLIPIAIISFSIKNIKKDLGLKFLLYVYFHFYKYFLVFIGYMIYKILTEKYFISIYLINCLEGLFYIFYTFILYNFKIKNDDINIYGDPLDFDYLNLFISCIFQIIINTMIKLIIYHFEEIYVSIPVFTIYTFLTILNIILGKNENNLKIEISLYLLNIFLFLNILIFIEVIIIKKFNLEKKTKKYLDKEQEKEKNSIINLEMNNSKDFF